MRISRLSPVALVLVVFCMAANAAPNRGDERVIYDGDFTKYRQEHTAAWSQQDTDINQRLAELEKRHGKRPNIVHILWDDNSLGQLGVPQMNKVLGFDTPRLNQMAREGISFTRMYTEPSCTPTRTAALTGRLAVLAGMHKVGFPPDGMGLHKDEVTIAEVLSKSGYQTAFVGKAHQGDIEQSYMTNQGFDFANFSMYNQFPWIGWQPGGLADGLFKHQWDKDYAVDSRFRPLGYVNQLEGRKGEAPRVFTGSSRAEYSRLIRTHQNMVVDYIKDNADADKPFYLAYWPHVFDPARRPDTLTANTDNWVGQSLEDMDRDIGDVLDTLRQAGIAENTLVIAMADNGPMHELAPLTQEPWFRGGKGDYLEGGIRVPAFAWWPGMIEEDQIVGDIVTVHDLFTTFAALGNGLARIPTDRVIDGIDQRSLLLNGDGYSRRDYYHVYTGNILAASIKQQFKRVWVGAKPGLIGEEFTNLYKDPREEHLQMPPYLWAWAAFDHMRERHDALVRKYPHRPPTHGTPYEGIVDLPPEAQAVADAVPTSYE